VGWIANRYSRRLLLLVAAVLMAATGIGFAMITDFWPLLVIAFVGTMNPTSGDASIFVPLEQTVLTQTIEPRRRTALFARYSVSAPPRLRSACWRRRFPVVPGLGLETLLDMRMDEAERKAGIEGGTPRTIEGTLYIAGAPLSKREARLDDGSEAGQRSGGGAVHGGPGTRRKWRAGGRRHCRRLARQSARRLFFLRPVPAEVQSAPPHRDRC
jgi:hypothetical protein